MRGVMTIRMPGSALLRMVFRELGVLSCLLHKAFADHGEEPCHRLVVNFFTTKDTRDTKVFLDALKVYGVNNLFTERRLRWDL